MWELISNWVYPYKAPYSWIVVSVTIRVQPDIFVKLLAIKPIAISPSTNISTKNNAHQHRPKANVSTSVFCIK
jgi:hypothetical protein